MAINEFDLKKLQEAEVNQENIVPISHSPNYPIKENFLSSLFKWVGIWALLLIGFVWIIDPYGASPLEINLPGVNTYKPKRIDIDRLIKPYEVWKYKPKTIFLGTSGIHQSIDPNVLKNTKYYPAYNAAIPASTLSQNAANLEQDFALDKNIKYVFVELFIYNFISPQSETPQKNLTDLLQSISALLLSSDALIDAIQTLSINKSYTIKQQYIAPLGNWVRPDDFKTQDTFNQSLYIRNIAKIHQSIPSMIIQPSAIESLERIVAICKKNHAELHLIITPSYPWDDYRLLSLGYWPLLEEWLKYMSKYNNVISFSQYNQFLTEKNGKNMKWWNDPIHFSQAMGKEMLLSLLHIHNPKMPKNFSLVVNSKTISSVIKQRREGLAKWVKRNTAFTKQFDNENKLAGNI